MRVLPGPVGGTAESSDDIASGLRVCGVTFGVEITDTVVLFGCTGGDAEITSCAVVGAA